MRRIPHFLACDTVQVVVWSSHTPVCEQAASETQNAVAPGGPLEMTGPTGKGEKRSLEAQDTRVGRYVAIKMSDGMIQ